MHKTLKFTPVCALHFQVAVINIFANSLVYVRIVPIEKSLELKRARQDKVSPV